MRKPAIILMCLMVSFAFAQSTHIIEPAILEVHYKVTHGKQKDEYALRCGKNVSQYFSINKLRDDSLRASPDPSMRNIVLDEMLEAAMHRDDPTKQRPASPGHGDYLYWNLVADTVSVYTRVFENKYLVEEEIPTMEWTIGEDSVRTILGYECHKATTKFRGREWFVWFTEDIPVSLGPWKLNGLPGIILQAECRDYITITAYGISTTGISPVTFYNLPDFKYQPVDRKKYLKMKTNPSSYPAGTILTPLMELE